MSRRFVGMNLVFAGAAFVTTTISTRTYCFKMLSTTRGYYCGRISTSKSTTSSNWDKILQRAIPPSSFSSALFSSTSSTVDDGKRKNKDNNDKKKYVDFDWSTYEFTMTINGKPAVVASQKSHQPIISPATGKVFAFCPTADTKDHLNEAVEGALEAFKMWKQTSFEERRLIMSKMADVLETNKEELGILLSVENGKPLTEGIKEAGPRCCSSLIGFSHMEIPVEVLEDNEIQKVEIHRRPYGVIGCIIPWNFPLHTLFQKIAPAIYAGNTCIVKPSQHTPLSTLRAMELLRDVCPPGVLQTLAGSSNLGEAICKHPDISKISFTGSTAIGIEVARNSVDTIKRLNLELGGNDAAIVLDDIENIEEVAQGLAKAAFANSGQVCHALKRLYVHESIHDEMCDALAKECSKYVVGHPLHENVTHGPITTKQQYQYVMDLVNEAVADGAKIICGGRKSVYADKKDIEGGYYFEPTILTNVLEGKHRIVDEEQFGPVLPVMKFTDPQDAIRRANLSEYGLTGSIWTKNKNFGYELASQLEAGTAFVNHMSSSHSTTSSVNWNSQGWKNTGHGCNRGLLGLLEYTQPQTVNQRKL